MSSGAGVSVADDCIKHFNDLKQGRKYRFVLYKFNDDLTSIIVDRAQERESEMNYEKFVEALPEDQCRYALFDLDYELEEGGKRSKICFISWAPDVAKVKSKMVFAASKEALKKRLVGVPTEIQATDYAEVEYEVVLEKASRQKS